MRHLIMIGFWATIAAAAGCDDGSDGVEHPVDARAADAVAPDAPTFGCWSDPVTGEWATDMEWKEVTAAGDYGSRFERVRKREPNHPYSIDLETIFAGGQEAATQRRARIECDDGKFYYTDWDSSIGLNNPGCPFPKMVIRAQAQVRVASCY